MHEMQPAVQRLVDLVKANGWQDKFEEAIATVASYNVPDLAYLTDFDSYIDWLNGLAVWAPDTLGTQRVTYEKVTQFYFVLDQEPLKSLQSKVQPGNEGKPLTPLSQWIIDFDNAWGSYLDTPPSVVHVEDFKANPLFQWDEFEAPPSGYFTFNQFFARHMKPGQRPIASIADDSVITSPADCTFVDYWEVDNDSNILVESKGLQWSIQELLKDSEYADEFAGGIFTHSFLNTNDYHRWHTPVAGTVLESRIVAGQVSLDIEATPGPVVDGKQTHELSILDGTGYQFVQTRGLIVIDSPIGLVACLPMGMWPVSSVVITADKGVTVHKGEELGYFAFGGSDFVMVFQRKSNVLLNGRPGKHVRTGTCIGYAHPNL
ncbi:phosphatidylserine decarboxylase [Mycobacterium sp. 155]|uniref:phosphatidylserine decarboxylase n=1 Tax=Mycobacterium sp. 155 TaxID=1157943 RepID=UPI0018DEEAE9|nr:phosphatidylserine decarboxylase [Mycobacterium sp. 155]